MWQMGRRGWPGTGGGTPTNPTTVPTWFKFCKTHTDLQAAALTNDIEIYSLPAGGIITGAKVKHSVQFAGTGITDYKVSLGISGNLESLLPLYDVDTVPADDEFAIQENFDSYNHGAVQSIRLAAESVGANLDQSTAGALCVWLLVSEAI